MCVGKDYVHALPNVGFGFFFVAYSEGSRTCKKVGLEVSFVIPSFIHAILDATKCKGNLTKCKV